MAYSQTYQKGGKDEKIIYVQYCFNYGFLIWFHCGCKNAETCF